MSAYNFGVKGV